MTRNPNSPRRSSLRPELLAGLAALAVAWCVVSFVPAFHNWLTGDVRFYENWGNWTSNHLAISRVRSETP